MSSKKVRLATVWLDGCSGCHMSFLDVDERILALAEKVDLVYSPLVDAKDFPEEVDVTLIEGAVATTGDLEKIRHVREHTRILVSLGDCAVTANVPSMRNPCTVKSLFDRAYGGSVPAENLPALLPRVRPVHEFVEVDVFVPGCPPPADAIYFVLAELCEGRKPDLANHSRFGA